MILPGLSKRERRILYLAIVVGLFSLFCNFLLEPAVKHWRDVNQQVASKEAKLKKNLKIVSQKEVIEVAFEKYAGYAKMEGSEEEEMAVLLSEIERLASRSVVRITDIKPQPIRDMKFYKRFNVECEAEATIGELSAFLYELQNSPQLLKVERLQINTKSTQSSLLKSYILITKVLIP